LSRVVWKIQQLLDVPYLNYFSSLRRYDACLQTLPGHDVVFERNSLYNSGVAMACKKLALPYVVFFDADQIAELDFMGKPLTGLLRRRAVNMLRYNLDVAHRVICVSDIAKDHLMKTWDVPSDKLVVLPNAVDVERFKPDPELGAQTRASLSLTTNPLLVFVGSFYQWHDVATLLNAFAVVLKTHSEARLILVGDGTERESMIKLSLELGIEHAVQFTGFVTHAEVSRYVNAADIAVVPVPDMKQEMWLSPMKLFEYMASGKAIVASAMGQIKEVIRDSENGLLVPAGDEAALAGAVNRLLDDDSLRARLGGKARADAVQNHSWGQYFARLEEVFTGISKSQTAGVVK
jgi:glycosyltransferase involved in cell wall biosynthesis